MLLTFYSQKFWTTPYLTSTMSQSKDLHHDTRTRMANTRQFQRTQVLAAIHMGTLLDNESYHSVNEVCQQHLLRKETYAMHR
jgi:hypothetical protein